MAIEKPTGIQMKEVNTIIQDQLITPAILKAKRMKKEINESLK